MSVAVIVGSSSDLSHIQAGLDILKDFEVDYEVRVLSAHRTPIETGIYVHGLHSRGFQIVIAGAGLSAALPGVAAAHTTLPVIGLPIPAGPLKGQDALLSIAQMPPGVPVATVGIGNSKNAALLALRILALQDDALDEKLDEWAAIQAKTILAHELNEGL